MINAVQVELAKTLWEQARTAATQSHEAWGLVLKSQKTLMESMRGAGAPFSLAADQYQKLMDFHAEQYAAALAHMDKMSAEYQKALASLAKKGGV